MKRAFCVAAILDSVNSSVALAEKPTGTSTTHSQQTMQSPASGCPKQADWSGSTGDDGHTTTIGSATTGAGAGKIHSINIGSATSGAGAGKRTQEACANGQH